MASRVVFTLDLEDHLDQYSAASRYPANTMRLLDFLSELQVQGTVFVVGRLAEASAPLVREVAARGHEIACHSYKHTALDRETPATFREETRRAKDVLEQLSGAAVAGFRAPFFSLMAHTTWTLDLLRELGFTYSSSVLPAPNPIYGFPGAPRNPFRWPSGLIELPCPLATVGPMRVPLLGGIYLRYAPQMLVDRFLRGAADQQLLWTYLHPYDFDADEPYTPMPGRTLAQNLLLNMKRGGTFAKMRRVLEGRSGRPFREILSADFAAGLRIFQPA